MPAPAPVLWLANGAHEALTSGEGALDASIPMPARTYCAILRALVASVRRRWAHQPWAESGWRRLGVDPVVMRPQLAVPFDVQPLSWRLRILELGGHLLRPWPHAFLASTGFAHRPARAASRARSGRGHGGTVGGDVRGTGAPHRHTVPAPHRPPGPGFTAPLEPAAVWVGPPRRSGLDRVHCLRPCMVLWTISCATNASNGRWPAPWNAHGAGGGRIGHERLAERPRRQPENR